MFQKNVLCNHISLAPSVFSNYQVDLSKKNIGNVRVKGYDGKSHVVLHIKVSQKSLSSKHRLGLTSTVLGKNVRTKVNPYNFASSPPIPLIFFLETL